MKNVIFREKERDLLITELCGEILSNARNELYLKMRFLSEALYGLRYRPDAEIHPVGTDGENLFFVPEELIEMANLRMEYPDMGLKELGTLIDPPISKSGVNNQLKKIVQFSEELKERKEQTCK